MKRIILPLVLLTLAARLVPAQSPQPDDFNGGVEGSEPAVLAVALQPDGKILVGGLFLTLGGQTRFNIGRLHSGGTVDGSFNPGADDSVNCLAVQTDGKILVGGSFTSLGGQPRAYLGRLNADGTLDTTFNPGSDGTVLCLAIQADGKILVGGAFTMLDGRNYPYLGRLNPNGALDTTFHPGADFLVSCLAVQTDGKILVGGSFFKLGGQSRAGLGRLNVNGSLDTTFNSGVGGFADASVYSIAVQADGRILVGGSFDKLGGQSRANLGRLQANGTLDTSFNPNADGGEFSVVNSLVLLTDGQILVAGTFDQLGGMTRNNLGRLNPNGSIDNEFDPGVSGGGVFSGVYSLAVQADGKIVVGGDYTTLGGQARQHLGRLNNTAPANQRLVFAGSTISWQRSGTSPEFWRTAFEYSVDGLNWISLGAGMRVPGGWERTGVAAPPKSVIRARGFVSGGGWAGWFLQELLGGPVLLAQPASQTNTFGTTARFSVTGEGSTPLTYQWFKDNLPLSDQGAVLGANSPGLILNGVTVADRGGYFVVVSNSSGSVTSLVATLSVRDPAILLHPASTNLSPGASVTFKVTAAGTPPLHYQWHRDGAPVPEATNSSLTLSGVLKADAVIYTVTVSNANGSTESLPAVLTVNTSALRVDSTFNPRASASVQAMAVQPDGKIVVGGGFTTMGGVSRSRLARLHPDGSLDEAFNPGVSGGNLFGAVVSAVVVQADGKIVVGGDFSTVGGQARYRIARLNPDGSLDTQFKPTISSFFDSFTEVEALALQPDGKILVGGVFEHLGSTKRVNIGRLNANGTTDGSFKPGLANYDNGQPVHCLALQADGAVLVGGRFEKLAQKPRASLGRVSSKGKLDPTFDPRADGDVYCLAVQANGKILVGGGFTELAGQPRLGLARLNPDGTLESGLNLVASGGDPNLGPAIYSLAVQADRKILVGGNFTTLGGQSRRYIARLNEDGTLDSSFVPAAGNTVRAVALQGDGDILVGGNFSSLAGQSRTGIGRLKNTDPAIQTLSYATSVVTWRREGTGPEVVSTTFAHSTNGVTWTSLGAGTRVAGGWQQTGVVVPPEAMLRARGLVAGGALNASSWFVEGYAGRPLLLAQPLSRTNGATTTVRFTVEARGGEPLNYQWLKNGIPLLEIGQVTGVNLSTLTLSNVLRADEGVFSVVVSNASGSVTSLVANLIVLNPRLLTQPGGLQRDAGESATFSVVVVGSPPPTYQWYHDGTPVPGATNTSLTLQNLTAPDSGDYTVVASNTDGNVTSEPALLEVNTALVDPTFDPGAYGGFLTAVNSLAVQEDNKILVGGDFSELAGEFRGAVGRLKADGTLDAFDPQADWYVFSLASLAGGKVLVAGGYGSLGGQERSAIGRVNPDGTLDGAFNPGATGGNGLPGSLFGTDGIDGTIVYTVTVQPDGKTLLGGYFEAVAGVKRSRIARLNADGTLDTSFVPGKTGGYLRPVRSLAVQADGKIVVGGEFTSLGGKKRPYLGRLKTDGKLDPVFAPVVDGAVLCLAVQPDGKILVGGEFTSINKQPRNRLARLNTDGTLDPSFNPDANGRIYAMLVQADGKIVLGGSFTVLQRARRGLARVHPDGKLDRNFNPVVTGFVQALAEQSDGSIVLGGRISSVGSQSRGNIARLLPPASASRSGLTLDSSDATDAAPRGARLGPPRKLALPLVTSSVELSSTTQLASPLPIRLSIVRDGSTAFLSWTGGQPPYQVQWTDDLNNPDSWRPLGQPVTDTNSIALPISPGTLFLQVRGR